MSFYSISLIGSLDITEAKISVGNIAIALAKYLKKCNHYFNFNDTIILVNKSNFSKRKIQEILEIMTRNSVNCESDDRDN